MQMDPMSVDWEIVLESARSHGLTPLLHHGTKRSATPVPERVRGQLERAFHMELARNVVRCREQRGAFRTRRDVLKVERLGAKAFEQAAGFLRVPDGSHALDASGVHPERYALVERMAHDQGCSVGDLLTDEGRPPLGRRRDVGRPRPRPGDRL